MTINKNASLTIYGINNVTFVYPDRKEAFMEIPIISRSSYFGQFLEPLKQYFTNPQYRNLTHYLLGLLLCEGKRTIAHLYRSQSDDESYNRLHHFLSESPWDEEAMNDKRIEIMTKYVEKAASGQAGPVGFLIGDDTTNPKRGKEMAGFGLHYSAVEDTPIPSQSIVTTLYHFQDFSFPFYPALYKN